MANKEELVRFLDEHVFDRILKAREEQYSPSERDDLEYVQKKTETEKQRYHQYSSADEVIRMYQDDLHSDKAESVNSKLKKLGLPRLADVRDQFEKRAA